MEHESDSVTNCSRYGHQRVGKKSGVIVNKSMSRDHPNYSTIKISKNTEKSPGDLRRLVVTQVPVEDQQVILVWKALEGEK